jgi:hypothetical protein
MTQSADDIKIMYRHDLLSFIKLAFWELHPNTAFQDNWHIHVLADYLNRVERGEIKRLIINMPPRMLKSHCATISFPTWLLGRNPHQKILTLHSGQHLGKELEESCARLMQSERYRALFNLRSPNRKNQKLSNAYGGFFQFLSMDHAVTGLGADTIIVDDPISATDAQDKLLRDRVNKQFTQNVLQRLDDKKTGAIIVVMQRLHEEDLSGYLLQKSKDWVHLDLSAIAMQHEEWRLSDGKRYRRNPWEALHPERESLDELLKIRTNIGGYAFSAQYLQFQLKVKYCAVQIPKAYRSLKEWEEKDYMSYFKEFFLRDVGSVVVPEPPTLAEWVERFGAPGCQPPPPEYADRAN